MARDEKPPGEEIALPVVVAAPAEPAYIPGPAPEKVVIVQRENGSGQREILASKYSDFMQREGHDNYVVINTEIVGAHHSDNA